MNHPFAHRLSQLQAKLPPHALAVIAKPADVEYLTGIPCLVPTEREAIILMDTTSCMICLSSFTTLTAHIPILKVVRRISPAKLQEHIQQFITSYGIQQLLLDTDHLTASEFLAVTQNISLPFQKLNAEYLASLRVIKHDEELELLSQAGHITAQVYAMAHDQLKVGVTEEEIKLYIQQQFLAHGASGEAFPSIVAFGTHTASPHHQPTQQKLAHNMPVLIDLGAKYQGYCSDMTRTLWFGDQPEPEFVAIEQAVHGAYQATLSTLTQHNHHYTELTQTPHMVSTKPNEDLATSEQHSSPLTYKDLDASARTYLKQLGYDSYFIHTTGHGIGLEIHEYPSLNWQHTTPVHSDIVVTIEPGIYKENQYGYRYENTVHII